MNLQSTTLFLMLGILTGCGGPRVEKITGSVLVDGSPLDHAEVCFWPHTDLKLGMFVCWDTAADGTFTIQPHVERGEGWAGDYVVVVRENPARYRTPRFPRETYSSETNTPWHVSLVNGINELPAHDIPYAKSAR